MAYHAETDRWYGSYCPTDESSHLSFCLVGGLSAQNLRRPPLAAEYQAESRSLKYLLDQECQTLFRYAGATETLAASRELSADAPVLTVGAVVRQKSLWDQCYLVLYSRYGLQGVWFAYLADWTPGRQLMQKEVLRVQHVVPAAVLEKASGTSSSRHPLFTLPGSPLPSASPSTPSSETARDTHEFTPARLASIARQDPHYLLSFQGPSRKRGRGTQYYVTIRWTPTGPLAHTQQHQAGWVAPSHLPAHLRPSASQ